MSGVRLRRADVADAPAITAIHLAARRHAVPWLPELRDATETRTWIAETVLAEAEVWVAVDNTGTVAGFLALAGDRLEQLYVAPRRQGRGIGSRLLLKAKELRPAGLRLYTFARNRRARDFYEARGFVAVAVSAGTANEEREPDVLYAWQPAPPI
jgi:ribosomal protein S18 acetylase RimI-like enzyme